MARRQRDETGASGLSDTVRRERREGSVTISIGWRVTTVTLAALALLCVPSSQAQETTENVLKAAFIYHFATFTQWPSNVLMEGMPIRACVIGDSAVANALSASDRDIDGRELEVTMRTVQALDGCHLLYVSPLSPNVIEQAIAAADGSPILTISDAEGFARGGGVIELFVERGKMRFRISLASAMGAELELSSRLLSLAELIDDSND